MLEIFYKGNSLITNTESEKTQIRKHVFLPGAEEN